MGLKRQGPDEADKKPCAGVKSAARTIEIIEYFTTISQPVRTREISDALNIPNSSVDEILRTLAGKGFLAFNRRTKRYAPSYKIVGMAQAIERGFFGGDCLRGLLNDLRQETGASVYLTSQNDCWVENVAAVQGSWLGEDNNFRRELLFFDGGAWAPSTNFAGAMLTLRSNVEIIDLAVRSQEIGLAPKSQCAMNDLIEKVKRIRYRGFALCRRDDDVKVESIACPMHLPQSDAPMAVGLLGDKLLENDRSAGELARTMQHLIARHVQNWNAATA